MGRVIVAGVLLMWAVAAWGGSFALYVLVEHVRDWIHGAL